MAWFMNGILLWGFIMITLMAIGGFFMFRKFLKKLPKEDGKSMMDWEDEYIDQTRHLWTDETLDLLNALVMPVPAAFGTSPVGKSRDGSGSLHWKNGQPR